MKRLRRSAHFVPGANEKMFLKSLDTEADSLILDLEDAVTPDNKTEARKIIAEWLKDVDFGNQERIVRMNPIGSAWGIDDIEITMEHPPDAYLVPKINSSDELKKIDEIITTHEKRYGHPENTVRLIVLGTETPEGLLNIRDLPLCPRVDALTWGAEDLSAAIGARDSRDREGHYLEVFLYARLMTLLAATAADVQPLDTVYTDVSDTDGLERECYEAASMGFTGKITIHPQQIEVVNASFSPSQNEIEESLELLALFEKKQKEGLMAFRFRGKMVDAPHLSRARRVLELAQATGLLASD